MLAKYTFGLTSALRLLVAAGLFWAPAAAAAPTADKRVALQIERLTRADPELGAFYATRNNRPLWSTDGRLRPEAAMVVSEWSDPARVIDPSTID